MNEQLLLEFLQSNLGVLQKLDEKLHTLISLTHKIDKSIGTDDVLPMEELKGREGFSLVSAEKDRLVQCLVGGQTIIGIAREKILQHEKIVVGGGDIANPDIYPIPFIIRGAIEGSTTYNITQVNPAGKFETVVTSSGSISDSNKIITVGLDKGSLLCNGTWEISILGFDNSILKLINMPETILNRSTGQTYSTAGSIVSDNKITLLGDSNKDKNPPTAYDVLTLPLTFSITDILKQFPFNFDDMLLAANATYIESYYTNKKLLYLSVDLPQGVKCTIKNNDTVWLQDTDSIGALEFINGILFENFVITVVNTTSISQNWSVKAIFEAYE